MLSVLRPAAIFLTLFSLLTGVLYPLVVTGAAQALFPDQANGSLIKKNGQIVGSRLIGQMWTSPRYFWSRPSATGPHPYNAAASGGSNLGPINPALTEAVNRRVLALRNADPSTLHLAVPIDLATTSGSGLDPHISPAAALFQVNRIAHARAIEPSLVRRLVADHVQGRTLGLFGEPRVNVLLLNQALDEAAYRESNNN